jgi:hypothetical protein
MTWILGASNGGVRAGLSNEERSRHVHIVGSSGSGKSKLLESLIRQDIIQGRGLCLIDPHGPLADNVLAWCSAVDVGKHRRVHVIELHDEAWTAGFNPLRVECEEESEARADAFVAACSEVWGGEDIDQTPLLATCLQLLSYTIAAHRLTLAEAVELSSSDRNGALRQKLTAALPNSVYAAYWRELEVLSKRDFEERFSSTRRRLLRFLGAPPIRRMLGQRERVLDLRTIMDRGEILIVNLSPRNEASQQNARLLGTLLVNEFRLCAFKRDPLVAATCPYSLYIDECYDFLTSDVEQVLDSCRKFGLHAVLCHQRLSQLRKRSDALFNGVMAGGQSKIVFGGLSDEDAELMARELFRSSFNLERVKHVLDKPVVVDEVPMWLSSESRSTGTSASEAWGANEGWSQSRAESMGVAERYEDEEAEEPVGLSRSLSISAGSGLSASSFSSSGRSTQETSTSGRAQAFKPIRQILPTATYSLEEEVHRAIVEIREMPNRQAILKRRGHPPQRFVTTNVPQALARPADVHGLIIRAHEGSPYVQSALKAEQEITLRQQALATGGVSDGSATAFWVE